MSERFRYPQPDHVARAARQRNEPPAGDSAEVADGRALALLDPLTLRAGTDRKAARTVVRACFRHGHEQPDGTVRQECGDPQAHASDTAAARDLLDRLGLLPRRDPDPVPEAPQEPRKPAPAGPSPSAVRRAARVAEFRRLLRSEHLNAEEAAVIIGVSMETAFTYLKEIREDDQRAAYFEGREAGFTPREACEIAGLPEGGWRQHEGAWQARLAAEATP